MKLPSKRKKAIFVHFNGFHMTFLYLYIVFFGHSGLPLPFRLSCPISMVPFLFLNMPFLLSYLFKVYIVHTQYEHAIFLCVWIILYYMMISSSTHFTANDITSFYLWLIKTPLYISTFPLSAQILMGS
jgi:hypothetical protein